MNWLELKVPPPIVLILTGVLMWGLSLVFPPMAVPLMFRLAGGVPLALLGAVLAVSGFRAFAKAKTTIEPTKPHQATTLVTTGVYRFTRNPMYLGMLTFSLGWYVYLSAWLAMAGPLLFVVYLTRFQIQPEEKVLAELFGEAYAEYRSKVRRWI